MGRKKGPRFYRTSVSASQSIAEIQELLSDFEVESYHVFRNPISLGFVVDTPSGKVPFKISPNVEGLRKRFNEPGVRSPKLSVEDVAWRQTKEMVELMLEVVESGTASLPEVFGGFALTSHGDTVGEAIESGQGQLGKETRLLLQGG